MVVCLCGCLKKVVGSTPVCASLGSGFPPTHHKHTISVLDGHHACVRIQTPNLELDVAWWAGLLQDLVPGLEAVCLVLEDIFTFIVIVSNNGILFLQIGMVSVLANLKF